MVRQDVSVAISLLIQIDSLVLPHLDASVAVFLYIGHPYSVFFLLSPFVFLARIIQQDFFDPQSPLYARFFQ